VTYTKLYTYIVCSYIQDIYSLFLFTVRDWEHKCILSVCCQVCGNMAEQESE